MAKRENLYGVDLDRIAQVQKRAKRIKWKGRPKRKTLLAELQWARRLVRRLEVLWERQEALKRPKGVMGDLVKINAHAGWKMLLLRMEPGAWYAYRDICVLMEEYSKGSFGWWRKRLTMAGMIERIEDPIMLTRNLGGKDYEALGYLYRLTAKGLEFRAGLGGA